MEFPHHWDPWGPLRMCFDMFRSWRDLHITFIFTGNPSWMDGWMIQKGSPQPWVWELRFSNFGWFGAAPFYETTICHHMVVSSNGGPHKSSIQTGLFHYKPSIWGYLYLKETSRCISSRPYPKTLLPLSQCWVSDCGSEKRWALLTCWVWMVCCFIFPIFTYT